MVRYVQRKADQNAYVERFNRSYRIETSTTIVGHASVSYRPSISAILRL
jgi:hypothetical protein